MTTMKELAQEIDEHYWVLATTPEDALANFLGDMNDNGWVFHEGESISRATIMGAVGILIDLYAKHDCWGVPAMDASMHHMVNPNPVKENI